MVTGDLAAHFVCLAMKTTRPIWRCSRREASSFCMGTRARVGPGGVKSSGAAWGEGVFSSV